MVDVKELKNSTRNISVLYVEDDIDLQKNTIRLLKTLFEEVESAEHGKEALEKYRKNNYHIVITDIHMPEMDGIELSRKLRELNPNQVIIITSAHDESRYLLDLINIGVDYFALKPLDINQFLIILSRVVRIIRLTIMEQEYKKHLEETVEQRTEELRHALDLVKQLSDEMVFRLTSAAELRDTDTGKHIQRIGIFGVILSRAMHMDKEFIDNISFAAPLHDIGKIGIPDTILLKDGLLAKEEFDVMKTHTTIGADILAGSHYSKINMIEVICLQHHERVDGTGYPYGLNGNAISMEGKIVNICDQYDALRSKRPYKPAYSHEKTLEILLKGDGRTMPGHFDEKVLMEFERVSPEFDKVYNSLHG
ncbi:MAG: response regulator [Spirochaetales bacterium]|nr:response regulator [Spirochaetales bacterium]